MKILVCKSYLQIFQNYFINVCECIELPHCDPTFSIAFLLSHLLCSYIDVTATTTTLKAVLHAVARSHSFSALPVLCCFCSCYCSHCAISTTVRGIHVLFVELFLGKALQQRKNRFAFA